VSFPVLSQIKPQAPDLHVPQAFALQSDYTLSCVLYCFFFFFLFNTTHPHLVSEPVPYHCRESDDLGPWLRIVHCDIFAFVTVPEVIDLAT
jgi:hypothetical protein